MPFNILLLESKNFKIIFNREENTFGIPKQIVLEKGSSGLFSYLEYMRINYGIEKYDISYHKQPSTNECQLCKSPFSLGVKHHCRCCGRLVDSNCILQHNIKILNINTPKRVCRDCYNILTFTYE